MAEKRRLSARERREPAAKRRVSEATTRALSPAQQTSKRKASTPAAASSPASTPNTPVEIVEPPLPTKIKDGEPLPTLPSAQSADLSLKEYQSIAESAVLLASLERSKKKWLSDGILVRYWTKPKKTKRDQIEGKNPPKESMSKVGPCNIVVGPHLFDAMLYTVKDPNAPPPVQYTPTQRPMVHYGHPNNFQQYHPYPQAPTQNQRPHPPQAAHGTPPAQQGHQHARPPPPPPSRTPNNQTPQRPSGPQSAQRPAANQNPPPQPPKPNPDPVIQMLATRAAQDPELKALMRLVASTNATQEQLRTFQAHIDELNAIIRAREQQQRRQQQQKQSSSQQQSSQPTTPTAAQPSPRPSQPVAQAHHQPPPQGPSQESQASQPSPATSQQQPPQHEQQTPTAQAQSQQPQKSPQSHPRVEVQIPRPPQSNSTPQNPNADSANRQPSASQPTPTTPQVKQEPGASTTVPTPTPVPAQAPAPPVSTPSTGPGPQQTPGTQPMAPPPPQPQQQAMGQRPGPQYQYQQPPYQSQPIQSRPPQYGSPTPYYRATPPRPPPPPRLNYKSVVFEFTSPLTPYGSSTSGHAGSGDRYLFPENTILEWLSGGTIVLASFLLVRKLDPNTPFPIETAPDTAPSRAKGKSTSKSKKADKNKDKSGETQKEKDNTKDGDNSAKKGDNNTQTSENKDSPAVDSKQGVQSEQNDEKTPQATDSTKSAADAKADDDNKPSNLKEYYQPITFRIYSANPKVLEPLARVVKPQDEVRKYMNEVMDRAERAPDGFLAYQLPREQHAEEIESESDNKKGNTPIPGSLVSGRSKLSRGRTVGEDSDTENTDRPIEEEEEEEELKDFYGPPTGILPLGI
ncbi:uncharacterized protein APUU_40556A [Aspergillus puulaauensis]|uniref:SWR1-complex protein 3 domain-containing protein n=1 Tax=Aspergillus puulaauensis TaxID=1220207 RepID=A0A7R7XM76_9EURO|nr:uncharacterized protein APUU_40556A [Aspergillus puulaauensis]BCS24112.1 hypothetical protein APUU_40556A [Aspergillus puulaauensis]